ncbi:MAG: ABC transporter permease subunit, partial [Verrucomicrobia bacterium]|nr:ABC transporter permease subunit [Verrucomicrobiota bacterium]
QGLAQRNAGNRLLDELAWIAFLGALSMGLFTADCISRERREGTLGLLVLSNLTAQQIVQGKIMAHGFVSLAALLGFVPMIMMTVAIGGVTGTHVVLTSLALLNVLFVSLASGLWISTLFSQRSHAVLATVALLLFLSFGAEILHAAFAGKATAANAVSAATSLGLAGWMNAGGQPLGFSSRFIAWFFAFNGLGWFFFKLAGSRLEGNWQDQPHRHEREPESDAGSCDLILTAEERKQAGKARPSLLTDPRPWETDPVRWRAERLGAVEGFIWVPMLASFLAQFGFFVSTASGRPTGAYSLNGLASGGTIITLAAGGLVAWAGAGFLLLKNAAFIVWARSRLRRDLRLQRQGP